MYNLVEFNKTLQNAFEQKQQGTDFLKRQHKEYVEEEFSFNPETYLETEQDEKTLGFTCSFDYNHKPTKYERRYLSLLKHFIMMQIHRRRKDFITVMPIATTNKDLLRLTSGESGSESPMNVSRFIKKATEYGLIARVKDSKYRYNQQDEDYNKSYEYYYSPFTEKKILDYCDKWEIPETTIVNGRLLDSDFTKLDYSGMIVIDKAAGSSGLAQFNIKTSDNEIKKFVVNTLAQRYPQYVEAVKNVNYINKFLTEDRKIKFEFNIDIRKNIKRKVKVVKSIAIRQTNSLCGSKNDCEGETSKTSNILKRSDILKKYNLTYKYDITSQVPTTRYFLNTGDITNFGSDFYYKIWNNTLKHFGIETITEEDFKRKENGYSIRDKFKSLFAMSCQFDKSKKRVTQSTVYRLFGTSSKDTLIGEMISQIWEEFHKVLNPNENGYNSFDSVNEIFLHTSCIEIAVMKRLVDMKINFLNVYDGFYLDKVINMEEIIKEEYINYYNEYIKDKERKVNDSQSLSVVVTDYTIVNNINKEDKMEENNTTVVNKEEKKSKLSTNLIMNLIKSTYSRNKDKPISVIREKIYQILLENGLSGIDELPFSNYERKFLSEIMS